MFDRPAASRLAWLALLGAASGALLAVAASRPVAAQYVYGPYGSAGCFAETQELARGAQQRAVARDMRNHAIARLNEPLDESHHFDMMIMGCSLHNGRTWCP